MDELEHKINKLELDINIPKPIIKWVGGKTQLLSTIIKYIPNKINNYNEIFVGGGSVLIAILTLQLKNKINIDNNINAYDINKGLIIMYNVIKNNPKELWIKINKYILKYNQYSNIKRTTNNPLNKEEYSICKENYYYWLRKKYNLTKFNKKDNYVKIAALFIFLNKTCFRGLYREGPNGFNVPYGNYKNPKILEYKHLMEIHTLIQNVNFELSDFTNSLLNIKENDFIYLDPPYVPENKKSFVKYNKQGFTLDNHLELFNIIKNNSQKIKFMLSNSNTKLVIDSFNSYNIKELNSKRNINSKIPNSKTIELLIINF